MKRLLSLLPLLALCAAQTRVATSAPNSSQETVPLGTEGVLLNLVDSVDDAWLLITGFLVFFMQAGFAMLEVGNVTSSNAKNILFKNAADMSVGCLAFWGFGWAIAFGTNEEKPNAFIGTQWWFFNKFPSPTTSFELFFFQYSFASTSATIVSGSIAERVKIVGYLFFSMFVHAFVFPLIAHWMWATDGWLSAYNVDHKPLFGVGAIDFAGDAAVHMVGGFCGLVGAIMVGYRGQFVKDKDRFPARFERDKDGKWHINNFPPNNESLATLGVLILWFGWYGFNCGSTGALVGKQNTASRVAVTTTFAASAGAVSASIFGKYWDKLNSFSLSDCLNGTLAGLVSITGPCAVVTPYAAIIIGAFGGVIFKLFSALLLRLRIDDPLDAFPVHGGCGMWGLLMSGFFATEEYTKEVYGQSHKDWGVFYGGNGTQLGAQIIALIVVPLWPAFWAFVIFGLFRLIDSRRYDKPLFIFMDYSTFETLTFGGKISAEPVLDYKDPLAREMADLPVRKNSFDGGSARGGSARGGSAMRDEESDSGTAAGSSDEGV